MIDVKPPKLNSFAIDLLKSGLNKAIGSVVESLGGSGPASSPNFSQSHFPDINDSNNSAGTRAPSTDPSKGEDPQLHLQQEGAAPAARIDPSNLVKSLEKINENIIEYLGIHRQEQHPRIQLR